MRAASRKSVFVLAVSDQGTFIVNRLDQAANRYGVGYQLLETTSYDADEVEACLVLLQLRRQFAGDGVVAIDCGANIGVHTVEWARKMSGWGSVVAIEAQERIFYALAGNLALNNCFNATAVWAAVAATAGSMRIPTPNYLEPASFGSLELRLRESTEFIGQHVDYSDDALTEIRAVSLDALSLDRVDLIKLDIEGMELDALEGGRKLIECHRPIVLAEAIKSDTARLVDFFVRRDYRAWVLGGIAVLAIHTADEVLPHLDDAPLLRRLIHTHGCEITVDASRTHRSGEI